MIKDKLALAVQSINDVRDSFQTAADIEKRLGHLLMEEDKAMKWVRGIQIFMILILIQIGKLVVNVAYSLPKFLSLIIGTPLAIGALLGTVYLAYKHYKDYSINPYYKLKLLPIREEIQALNQQYDQLIDDVSRHFENDSRIDIIPKEYRYPQAVDYFKQLIDVGRAHDMMQAMNIYEDQLHKWKMERQSQEMLDLQMQNLENSKAARRNSAMAAAFSAASMLSRD